MATKYLKLTAFVILVIVSAGFFYLVSKEHPAGLRSNSDTKSVIENNKEQTDRDIEPVYAGPQIEPLKADNKTIEFPYTDDSSGESLTIKSDKKYYTGFSDTNAYFSVTNNTAQDEQGVLLFYFPGQFTKNKNDPPGVKPATVTSVEVRVGDKWQKLDFFKNNIKINESALAKSLKKRKPIPEDFKMKAGMQISIPAGQTAYLRSRIAYPPGSKGEFWIETLGKNGGYGLLDPWYSSSWTYRKLITIDHFKVSGGSDLTNFPVLISRTDLDLRTTANGGKAASGSGEFIFTSSDGTTSIPYEIETYSSKSGQLLAWVNVTTLSATQDTKLYIYYGGPSSGATNQNKTGTWNAAYKGVWHVPDGTTLGTNDSTTNANDMTKVGSPVATTGQFDGGVNGFASNNNYLKKTTLTNGSTSTNTVTITAWIYATTLRLYNGIFIDNTVRLGLLLSGGTGNPLGYLWESSVDEFNAASGLAVSLNTWHYTALVITSTAATLYLDDKSWTNTKTHGLKSIANDWEIGMDLASPTDRFWQGSLDEVRIAQASRTDGWIRTEYANQSSPETFITWGGSEVQIRTNPDVKYGTPASSETKPGWYSSSWSYRKRITMDHFKVSGGSDLTNFPVLVSFTDNNLRTTTNGGKAASGSGEFIFTSSDGTTSLPYEIDSYSATTGQLLAWVNVTTLSVSTDTNIYIYYGGPSSGATNQNKTGTWNSSYKGVYHLKDGTNLSAPDSTGSTNNGTLNNTPTATTGQFDGGANFVGGSSQYITTANTLNIARPTISAWVKITSAPGSRGSLVGVTQGNGGAVVDKDLSINTGRTINWYIFDGTGKTVTSIGAISTDIWHYIVGVADGTNAKIYIDGTQDGSTAAGDTYAGYTGAGFQINGSFLSTFSSTYLTAVIDEARISNVALSADWIKTEYTNQSSPDTFYSLGAQEALSPVNPGLKIRGGVKIK